jgi:hypothetical protein
MPRTRSGGTLPRNIKSYGDLSFESNSAFALRRGVVKSVIYPEDPNNRSGNLEYVVTIAGQDYPGVVDAYNGGGIYNHRTKVRRATENIKPEDMPANGGVDKVYNEKRDGESVWVLMLGGDSDFPVIVGSDYHPRRLENPDYKEVTKDDGRLWREEFNGFQFQIDKDANLSIEHLGLKDEASITNSPGQDKEAVTENAPAIGTKVTMKSTGDLEVDIKGELLKFEMLKETEIAKFTLGELTFIIDGPNETYTVQNSQSSLVIEPTISTLTTPEATLLFDGNGAILEAKSNTITMDDSGIVATDGSGGEAKISGGKLAFTAGAEEVLAVMQEMATELSTQTAPGYGAPTSTVGAFASIAGRIGGMIAT